MNKSELITDITEGKLKETKGRLLLLSNKNEELLNQNNFLNDVESRNDLIHYLDNCISTMSELKNHI